MNIGLATDTFAPRINGVVQSVDTFAREFRRLGHRVVVFAPAFPGPEPEETDVWRFPSRRPRNNPEDRLAKPLHPKSLLLLRRLPELKLDVVHTHTPFSLGLMLLRWARRHGVPTVHTYHTYFARYVEHYMRPLPQRTGQWLVRRVSRSFCNRHDLVVTPSRAMARILRRYRVTAPIRVIPTGVDLEEFQKGQQARGRAAWNLSDQDQVLLSLGRISGEKNLELLLEVVERLAPAHPRLRLVLAGSGPGLEAMQDEVRRRRLADRVVFAGYVRGQGRLDLYAAADVFVLSSKTETQGLVLNEAMAAGKPCVAVGAMGAREALKHGGGELVPNQPAAFAAAVERLLSDPAWYAAKQAEAKAQVIQYSAAAKAGELLEIYRQLTEKKRPSAQPGTADT
ncbi:MAG: glycosyltransferase [candidate division FCPU426 bacterium]